MPKQDTFTQFIQKGRTRDSIERQSRRSQKFLQNKIKQFSDKTKKMQTARPGIGNMYLFSYDAKHKDKLPYFDRFPLSIVIGFKPAGILSLNLHYLPPRKRIILLNKLIQVSNIKEISPNSRLKLNYGIVKTASKLYAPAVKYHLFSQLRSKFIKVEPEEWHETAMLPLANFNVSNIKVYADSAKKY